MTEPKEPEMTDEFTISTRPTDASVDADAFIAEHFPDCAETTAGNRGHFCRGCSRAVGDYVEWPCADVWVAADLVVRARQGLLAEAERRGAEKALRDAAAEAEREFQLPREFGFEVRRFIEKRADAYRAGADR